MTAINLPVDGALYRHEPKVTVTASLVVAGDSFTEGSAASRIWRKFAIKVGRLLNIQNPLASGLGGTGYLKTITHYDGNERLNLLERVEDLYNPFGNDTRPDGIVFCMGINDSGLVVSDVAAAARATFDAVRAVTTEVPLFIVGPWQANETYFTELATALEIEATSTSNAYFIDNTGWISGTGNVNNIVGDGIADWTQSADQTHPSDEGQDYLAHRLAAELRGVIRSL